MIGEIIGLGTALAGNVMQQKNQDKRFNQEQDLMDKQVENQKELNKFNQNLGLETWHQTNYSAQRKELEKAGLNTGLLYGQGGGGGTTTGNAGGSASGGTSPSYGNELQTMTAMGLQLATQKANIELMESQATKNKVEATKIAGVDTDLAGKNIESLTQGIEESKAKQALTKVTEEIQQFDLKYKNETREEYINQLTNLGKKLAAETDTALQEAKIANTTVNEKINIIKTELAGKLLQNDLTKAGIQATNQEIQESIETIKQGWTKIEQDKTLTQAQQQIQKDELARKTIETKFNTGVMAETERGARIAKMIADGVGQFIPKSTTTTGSSSGTDGKKTWSEDYWTKTTKK